MDRREQDRVVDAEITMDHAVAHGGDHGPGNVWVRVLYRDGHVADGLAHHLEAAHHGKTCLAVGEIGLKGHVAHELDDRAASLDHVVEEVAIVARRGHSGTSSRSAWRPICGLSAARETRSRGLPAAARRASSSATEDDNPTA